MGKANEAKTFKNERLVSDSLTFCEFELICNFRYDTQNTIAHGAGFQKSMSRLSE